MSARTPCDKRHTGDILTATPSPCFDGGMTTTHTTPTLARQAHDAIARLMQATGQTWQETCDDLADMAELGILDEDTDPSLPPYSVRYGEGIVA